MIRGTRKHNNIASLKNGHILCENHKINLILQNKQEVKKKMILLNGKN